MQLRILLLSSMLVTINIKSKAQTADTSTTRLDPVEINFLSNYYEQDGNHSPVSGGVGSEKLSNITEQVVINIPVRKNIKINLKTGIEFFSSASQQGGNTGNSTYYGDNDRRDDDDDDDEYYSGASPARPKRSVITYGDFGITKTNKIKNLSFDGNIGYYKDDNATSAILGTGFTKSTKNNNNTFSASFTWAFDQWQLTDPGVIVNGIDHLGNGTRQSYSSSISYSRIFTKRFSAALISDFVLQKGLLSTPYHQVNFTDTDTIPAIERLPNSRIKFPVGIRLNYHATDWLILRTYYRYYQDTWGIKAHTISLETPLKLNQWLRIYPFYRFHTQTAADYFAPYNTLTSNEQLYYTADYDLSALQTHKMGIGFGIQPANGLFRTKDKNNNGRSLMMSALDFRYAYYTRNDGLTGHIFTAGMKFEIQRKE